MRVLGCSSDLIISSFKELASINQIKVELSINSHFYQGIFEHQ